MITLPVTWFTRIVKLYGIFKPNCINGFCDFQYVRVFVQNLFGYDLT